MLCISLRSHEETLNGLFDLPSPLRVVMTEHSGYCNRILRKRYESRCFGFFLLTGPLKYRKLTEPKQSVSSNCTFLLNTLTEKLCTSSAGSAGINQQREQQVLLFFVCFSIERHGNLSSLTVLQRHFTLI